MSLEFIDRLLKNWKDSNYKGINELSSYMEYIEPSDDYYINRKLIRDIEEVRYLIPSMKKLEEYGNTMDDLLEFYNNLNFIEGGFNRKVAHYKIPFRPQKEMFDDINNYLKDNSIKFIAEVGSDCSFHTMNLIQNSNARLITFSHMMYEYSWYSKLFIDNKYPGRSFLIFGHTKYTIPAFTFGREDNIIFDLIFVNKYSKDMTYLSILDMRQFADKNTIIILNNVYPTRGWGIGSYMAMNKLILEGVVKLIKYNKYDSNGIAILQYCYNGEDNKLTNDQYREIEIDIPAYEFAEYIKQNDNLDSDLIKLYIKKFKDNGLEIDDYLINLINQKVSDNFKLFS